MESPMAISEEPMVSTRNFDELIAELHNIFAEDRVNVENVKAILSSYRSNPKDWKKYAKYDPHRYTRNLVDEGNGKFNLILLGWGEGQGSSIHDHTNANCFVKVLDGQLMETRFAWPSDSSKEAPLEQLSCQTFQTDEVAFICDEMGIHRMENPSHTDSCATLHLYCPPFKTCKSFDEKSGHCNEVKITFWSKYGKRTPFTSDGSSTSSEVPENN